MPAGEAREYLSGLLIGAEWHDVVRRAGQAPHRITLIGSAQLAARYACVAEAAGCHITTLDARSVQLAAFAALSSRLATEAFAALEAGAHALKLFPAESLGLAGMRALLSVLPPATPMWPVGGVTPQSMAPWVGAGATGFGIGSQLFKPGMGLEAISAAAREFIAAWADAAGG